MIKKFDGHDRRILNFPAVHPCEAISPATLLQSLITLSHNICKFQTKFFPTQRKNARETIRQIGILSIFFDEIKDHVPNFSDSISLSFSELHLTFQKIQFLLEDCTRQDTRMYILMKAHFVTTQFRTLVRAMATALDVLPLDSIVLSSEVKELVELLTKQAQKAKMELDHEDENAMKRVILVLNQFENKFEPDLRIVVKILSYLGIRDWSECHKEIRFLTGQIERECSENGDEREVPLLSSLVGLLSYCRGVVFEECDFGIADQSDGRTNNLEMLSCLNLEDFRCPISLELMTDPVTVSTGQTYDRVSIQKWLKSGNLVCPKTGEKLISTELVPNTSLQKLIHQFCAEYGVNLAKSRKNNHDISWTILLGSPENAEAMRFLARFLTSRLIHGTDYQQNKAAYEIKLLAKSNIFNRSCLVEAGTIPPLLKLLGSADPSVQENAVSALLKLSKHASGKKAIMENRGLKWIVKVLKDGIRLEARQIAAAIIFYLSSVQGYRTIIGEKSETFCALLDLIKQGTTCGKKNSVVALFALLLHDRNQKTAIELGAVPILVHLLDSSSNRAELKTDTLAVLATLAESSDGSYAILGAAGLDTVSGLIHSISSRAGKEYCVSILHSLCINCGMDVVAVMAKDAGLMNVLYSILTEGTSHAKRKARSLIQMVQKFGETSSSRLVRELGQEQYIGVW